MKPDEFGVELRCTKCTKTRTYQERDDIPERYKDGCSCGGTWIVKPIGS